MAWIMLTSVDPLLRLSRAEKVGYITSLIHPGKRFTIIDIDTYRPVLEAELNV
jgi:hypothetical protein